MNRLINKLPVFGLVLAAVFAFAFTQADNVNQTRYGFANNAWYDVTNVSMGSGPDQYNCNLAFPSEQCLFSEKSTSEPIEDELGRFVPGVNLIPE